MLTKSTIVYGIKKNMKEYKGSLLSPFQFAKFSMC